MRMNFVQDATAKIEGLLAVNQDFLRAARSRTQRVLESLATNRTKSLIWFDCRLR